MPKGTRERLKVFADQALNDLLRAHLNIVQMADIYGQVHPEHRQFCEIINHGIESLATQITTFRKEIM